jgi:hypothetical protein
MPGEIPLHREKITVRRAQGERVGIPIDEIVVAVLGDLIEGKLDCDDPGLVSRFFENGRRTGRIQRRAPNFFGNWRPVPAVLGLRRSIGNCGAENDPVAVAFSNLLLSAEPDAATSPS